LTEDDLNAELAMIDENLCRTDMTLAERARIMARRKELYEEKHPETKHGANQHSRSGSNFRSSPAVNFAASTAAAIGKNERVVRPDVQRGTDISEEALSLVTRTPLDNTKYLNELMRTPKAEQVARVYCDLASPLSRRQPDPDAAYQAWIEEGQRWLNRDSLCRTYSVGCPGHASSATATDSSALLTMHTCAFRLGEAR